MRRASLFIAASWTGLGALVLTAVAAIAEAPLALTVPTLLLVIASSYVMLATRRADKYTEGLWNAGASLAFIALLVLSVGLPFVEGVYDGLRGYETSGREMPAQFGVTIAIAAFFVGQAWKRLLGDS
jgi:hypothetical protein